ncbi:MAG: alpha/beta hydrolase [Anaerolineales bacterium]|nr:alpha/beta hydrolase [Anaerolineales bacterium]
MSALYLDERIIHYEVLGRGRPVIFLHGWVGSWRYWLPAMQTTSVSFRAYALDLWGFGNTSRDPERYTLEQQAALLESFLQRLGIAKVALIGHGLGGLISILFSHYFPETVNRLMLVDCPLDISAVHSRLGTASPADLTDWLLEKNAVTEPARSDAPKADPQAILASLKGLNGDGFTPMLKRMSIPCLLVHGQNDLVITAPDNDRLESLPAHFHQVVLKQSGHFPMLDESARFNRLLTDFLALVSGESPRQLQLKEEWKRRVR